MRNPIPTDWKQTKLGKIPLEWWNGKIQDLVDEKIIEKPIDGNHGNIHPKSSDFVESGIPFVMANDIINEHLCLEKTSKIKKEQANNLQKGFSYAGDVLFTHKGSVGNTAIVPELETDYIMLTPQVTYYRVKDQKKLDPIFLRKLFQSTRFQSLLESLSGGGTRAYIGITAQRELPFYCPKIPEQHRIVAVLETWDKSLEKLTRKIELKKNVKKGLMQELLSGKRRLKGFSGEWQTVKLGEVCRVKKGTSFTKKELIEGNIPVIAGGQQPACYHNQSNREGRTITISASGAYAGYVDYYGIPIFASDCSTIQEKTADVNFIYAVLKSKQNWIYHALQTGGAQPHVYPKDLEKLKLAIPKSKEEQTAIAQILMTADNEIAALEKKKQILKDQKKYLLNNLITGQIRTPENLTMNK